MTTTRQELRKVVGELSEDESQVVLKFAEWLIDKEEEFTAKELAILQKGEHQISKGDFAWWRDVKRTKV